MWLPRWRTLTNPCCSKTAQSCRPEKILSLPNGDLKPGHEHLAVHAALDLRRVGRFEEQLQGFDQVHACFIDRGALAGNVHLRAQGYIAVALPFDDRRQLPGLHGEEAYHATAPATTFPSSIHPVVRHLRPFLPRAAVAAYHATVARPRLVLGDVHDVQTQGAFGFE